MGKKKAVDDSNLHTKVAHMGISSVPGFLSSVFCPVDNPLYVGFPFTKKGVKEETPYSLAER